MMAAALMSAIGGHAAAAPGDLSTKFPIDDNNPSANLPTPEQREAEPLEFGYLIQDLVARGEGAYRDKNWQGVVKYYEALARAVPDRAISYRRLCAGYAELGKIDVAASNCAAAMRLGGALVMDHFRFVNLTLQKSELGTQDVSEVEASLAHLRAHIADKKAPEPAASAEADALGKVEQKEAARTQKTLPIDVEVLGCKLAVRLHDAKRIDACLGALRTHNAPAKVLLPFEWSRALVGKDRARVQETLAKATTLGFPAETVAKMKAEEEKTFGGGGSSIVTKLGLFGSISVAFIALGAALWKLSSARRRLPRPATEA